MSDNKHSPAYPQPIAAFKDEAITISDVTQNCSGFTKREHITIEMAKALVGYAGTPMGVDKYTVNGGYILYDQIAKDAAILADALLTHLENTSK